MAALFWIGFSLEALVTAVLAMRALQRSAQGERGYVPPGDVARILKPLLLLVPLCAGGLVALAVFHVAWLAALIVWLPLLAVLVWVLLMLIGGLGSGRWN